METTQPPAAFTALGEALWLFAQAPLYAGLPVETAMRLLLPPLRLGQWRLWRRGAGPVGFASWAMLSAEAEARVLGGAHLIGPEEWATGERVVVTDFVAPFGDARAMVADLRRNALRGRDIAATRRAPDGGLRRVARYAAVDAAGRRVAPLRAL